MQASSNILYSSEISRTFTLFSEGIKRSKHIVAQVVIKTQNGWYTPLLIIASSSISI